MSQHEHQWQANGTVAVEKVSHSPVSTWDDVLYRETLAVQSCACGEVKRTIVARDDQRTRHEQYWREKRQGGQP